MIEKEQVRLALTVRQVLRGQVIENTQEGDRLLLVKLEDGTTRAWIDEVSTFGKFPHDCISGPQEAPFS